MTKFPMSQKNLEQTALTEIHSVASYEDVLRVEIELLENDGVENNWHIVAVHRAIANRHNASAAELVAAIRVLDYLHKKLKSLYELSPGDVVVSLADHASRSTSKGARSCGR